MSTSERQVETVKVYSVEAFEAKVRELNKKAAKAGVAPIVAKVVGEWIKEKFWQRVDGDDIEVVYFYKEGVIEWTPIVYEGGWRLEGVIDHTEGLVKSVPGSVVELQGYKERGPVCDHCHTSRDRAETFVLSNEAGEVAQVGRTCIHLFLGVAVERALAGVGLSSGLGGLEEEQRGHRLPQGYGVVDFLASAATVIRLYGWRSRSAAFSGEGRATADLAWENLENARLSLKDRHGVPLWVTPSEQDIETAKATAVWLASLVERRGLSDYLVNLAQIGQNDFVSSKSSGFAASAINAWGKEQEQAIKQAAERQQSGQVNEYVGAVGGKLVVNATLVKSPGWDSQYGYTFAHRFVDDQGHVIVWKTGTELDKGRYSLTATVKGHEEYKGEKQTVVTRAKVGLPKEVAA